MGSYVAGFKKLHVGVFNDDASKIIKKMVWENEDGGTVNMNITGLAPEMVDMWASNQRVWMKKQGTNEVKSDIDLFNIPTDDLNTVLGREKDENGTAWVGDDTRAPYVAVVGESEAGVSGEPVYCALLKGTFSLDSIEFKTKGEKAEAPEPTKLNGDWMNRKINDKSRVYGYHEGSKGAEEFLKEVFVGYEQGAESSDSPS
ncbi:phage tail protein [Staphylococcus gallinarum]|uniref:Tail protein n=1 Tax=Staphylococcus gallinarum TaxID=1293 RepID=A0ABQ0XYU9_STAGA|nr:major tail protein [Staphylococcus gallinarum]KIR10675.1 tail protein [Staphylococcus gallinarum]RTX82880.1 phage tail protein [Staphylococcus gallinarum]GEQ04568.1 tail protein [Staphylococcus gallinarum]